MTSYAFRLLNVFAESCFGGNPLCVFEDARGLRDEEMQALALQFNLSETTFILPGGDGADARVRVFTPDAEMRFAGHPALGTARVVSDLLGLGASVRLGFAAGVVTVREREGAWTFTAPSSGMPRTARAALAADEIAGLLGLDPADLHDEPLWVDTGSDQLLVPLRTPEAVMRAAPDGAWAARWPASSLGRKTAYVFAFGPRTAADARQVVHARYFHARTGGGVAEDPGTGSACANLGGWLLARGAPMPAHILVEQGDLVRRPCRLRLDVDEAGAIQVGGGVIEIGRGEIRLPR